MGPLMWLSLCVSVGILAVVWTKHGSSKIRFIPITLILLAIAGFILGLLTWEDNSGKEHLKYHFVEKVPFEYNPSDREYYIHYNNEFINAEAGVYGFSERYLEKPEYDSCYVYKVETPVFMGFLDNHKWHEDYVYRQSRDILLEYRSVDKVEIHEGEN